MQSSEALNKQFAIAGELKFCDRGDGFIVAEIGNGHCTASIALNGGHLLAWQPTGEAPVIWMSQDARFENGKSIRGGVPVCWPWFGAYDSQASFPAHGFARTSIWQVVATQNDSDSTSLRLALQSDAGNPLWPFACRCMLDIHCGRTLEMELTTDNLGEEAIMIGQALHTYFEVGDIRSASVLGLDGREYLDKPDQFRRKLQSGAITFSGEVDRIYLQSDDACVITDPVLNRQIHIEKSGSLSTVVWNPWSERAAEMGDLGPDGYLGMLCVESANAAEDVVSIAPGASHRLSVRYSITG